MTFDLKLYNNQNCWIECRALSVSSQSLASYSSCCIIHEPRPPRQSCYVLVLLSFYRSPTSFTRSTSRHSHSLARSPPRGRICRRTVVTDDATTTSLLALIYSRVHIAVLENKNASQIVLLVTELSRESLFLFRII